MNYIKLGWENVIYANVKSFFLGVLLFCVCQPKCGISAKVWKIIALYYFSLFWLKFYQIFG